MCKNREVSVLLEQMDKALFCSDPHFFSNSQLRLMMYELVNLWDQHALDALYCLLHHRAPLCHGSILRASAHDVHTDRNVSAVNHAQHHERRSDVCAFSVCVQLEHRCKMVGPLKETERKPHSSRLSKKILIDMTILFHIHIICGDEMSLHDVK